MNNPIRTITIAALCASVGLLAACGDSDPKVTANGSSAASEAGSAVADGAKAAGEAVGEAVGGDDSEVTIDDIRIELIELESQCFDSAGALVTVEPDVYTPGAHYDGKATLVYEVHGGEFTESFRIELDGENFSYQEQTISTASCDYNLEAVPVRLIER